MKPLTKKILEAGLVDKHAAKMFETWGQLEQGSNEIVGRKMITETGLRDFVDDIEQLIEPEDVKETRLDIRVTRPPVVLTHSDGYTIPAVEDEMGRYIVGPGNGDIIPGEKINHWIVEQVEPLYEGDRLVAYQITVDKGE